jgi:AsmA protein
VDAVRARVAAEVERQTGRKLVIGSAGVSFSGGLGVSLGNVELSAPRDMGGRSLLTAERIEVRLALLPLVLREVRVEHLTLFRPVLDLRVDAAGRRSWDFARNVTMPVRYAQIGGRQTDAERLPPELTEFARNASVQVAKGSSGGLDGLSLADVRVVEGVVRYEDAMAASVREVREINADFSLPTISGPLSMKGRLVFKGERIDVDARIDRLDEVLAGRRAAARIDLTSDVVKASYDGRLSAGPEAGGKGRFAVNSRSARTLAQLVDLPLTGLDELGAVSLSGTLEAMPGSVSFSSASFAAGATAGAGNFTLEVGGERPRITGNLSFPSLDLDRLAAIGIAEPITAGSSAGRFAAPPRSIDDLIRQRDIPGQSEEGPAVQVRGFRLRAGNQWEIDAIDASVLELVDVDARVEIGKLVSARLEGASLQTRVELKAGVLRISLGDGQIAGGNARGLISVDATKPALSVGANLSGDGVSLRPLLDLIGVSGIEGKGRLAVSVSAQGGSERELVSTIGGSAEVVITDGAVRGWDADAIVAGLSRGKLPPVHRQMEARTPFRRLSASFQIAHGVARSKDILLDSATVGATGTGTINIVDRNIDLQLKPRIAAGGVEVPVRIAGPWEEPKAVADLAAALKSPQAQQAARQLREGNVDGALRSVLGNDPKAEEKIGKAKELLRGLLRR